MRNPHVDSRQLCLPTLARFIAPRINTVYLEVLVVCGRRSFVEWRWHRKSDIENQEALVELGNRPFEVGLEWLGADLRAHARLAADPSSVTSRDE